MSRGENVWMQKVIKKSPTELWGCQHVKICHCICVLTAAAWFEMEMTTMSCKWKLQLCYMGHLWWHRYSLLATGCDEMTFCKSANGYLCISTLLCYCVMFGVAWITYQTTSRSSWNGKKVFSLTPMEWTLCFDLTTRVELVDDTGVVLIEVALWSNWQSVCWTLVSVMTCCIPVMASLCKS